MIRTARYNFTPENGVSVRGKRVDRAIGIAAERSERVEDGSWHNDEEETNVARVRGEGERENPARARKGGGRQIVWVKPRGDVTRRRMREGEGSADRIASSGCIEGGQERDSVERRKRWRTKREIKGGRGKSKEERERERDEE